MPSNLTDRKVRIDMDAQAFIKERGGPAAIATATGYSPGAVSLWRHRNRLPRSAWPELIAASLATLEELKVIEAASERAA